MFRSIRDLPLFSVCFSIEPWLENPSPNHKFHIALGITPCTIFRDNDVPDLHSLERYNNRAGIKGFNSADFTAGIIVEFHGTLLLTFSVP